MPNASKESLKSFRYFERWEKIISTLRAVIRLLINVLFRGSGTAAVLTATGAAPDLSNGIYRMATMAIRAITMSRYPSRMWPRGPS